MNAPFGVYLQTSLYRLHGAVLTAQRPTPDPYERLNDSPFKRVKPYRPDRFSPAFVIVLLIWATRTSRMVKGHRR